MITASELQNMGKQAAHIAADLKAFRATKMAPPVLVAVVADRVKQAEGFMKLCTTGKGMIDKAYAAYDEAQRDLKAARAALTVAVTDPDEVDRLQMAINRAIHMLRVREHEHNEAQRIARSPAKQMLKLWKAHAEARDRAKDAIEMARSWALSGSYFAYREAAAPIFDEGAAWELYFAALALSTYEDDAKASSPLWASTGKARPRPIAELEEIFRLRRQSLQHLVNRLAATAGVEAAAE